MKTFTEFKKSFEKIREHKKTEEEKKILDLFIKDKYEEIKERSFQEWLAQYPADEINKNDINLYRKIFNAFSEEDKFTENELKTLKEQK